MDQQLKLNFLKWHYHLCELLQSWYKHTVLVSSWYFLTIKTKKTRQSVNICAQLWHRFWGSAGSHLKARGLCLLRALVEVGHWLSVEVNPGAVVRIRGLLRCKTGCLAWRREGHQRVRNKERQLCQVWGVMTNMTRTNICQCCKTHPKLYYIQDRYSELGSADL